MEQRLRQHPYVQALEEGRLAPSQLRAFVGEQSHIIPSDLRSLALLISRCRASQPAVLSRCTRWRSGSLEAFEPLAMAVGMTPADRDAYEPTPGAQAYSAYLAWLCLWGVSLKSPQRCP